MAWRIFSSITKLNQILSSPKSATPFTPVVFPFLSSSIYSSIPSRKLPKKLRRKRKKKPGPRTTHIQRRPSINPHLEQIVKRDEHFRFLIRSKQFLTKQHEHVLILHTAGKLYRELGFPRGRKVTKFAAKHPLIFEIYKHDDYKTWLGFTDFMESLLEEEHKIMESMEVERVKLVKKLLMMCRDKKMPLSKIYHCRFLFGIPDDFRDWVLKFPEDFRVVNSDDGSRTLELVQWDPTLAVSALEKEFRIDEEKVRSTFHFPVKHGKALDLDDADVRRLTMLNTLPLISPYSDGWKYELWSLEAEKYRVGLVHEFLQLTLEKRAAIHQLVEFKEEFSLTKHTYDMLSKQRKAFYLAGTQMNWVVFLKAAYTKDGTLIEKDPQVAFNERLYQYAEMQHPEQLNLVGKDEQLNLVRKDEQLNLVRKDEQ